MSKKKGGWPSVYPGKDPKHRYQGIVTPAGAKALEAKRKELAKLAGMPVEKIGDGSLFEFLARGPESVKRRT